MKTPGQQPLQWGISIYDLRNKQEIKCIDQNRVTVTALDILPDDTRVVTGNSNGLVTIWDLRNAIQPVKQWNNSLSNSYGILELRHTDKHIVWLDTEYRLHFASADYDAAEYSYKIPYKNKKSNHHPCLTKINDNKVALGYKDTVNVIDLASYQHQSLELEGELPHTLYTLGAHDDFFTTIHISSLHSEHSSIQKWTLITQEEMDFIKNKSMSPKKNK